MNEAKHRALPGRSLLALAILAVSMPSLAQEAVENEGPLEEIVVTAQFRKSLQAAMDVKRNEVRVADAISSEDIGKFPSENIAEAIQRIPGVQISNVNGRGSTISVRGLGPQYANTTLNGQNFKSADFTSGFRFDIIQTELASGIQVIKSPMADLDSGGLAGTININTAKPLDHNERKVVMSLKAQESELSPTGDITPKANITYIDQFMDGTLGVFLNAGYQELDDRVDNFWMDRWFVDGEGTADEVYTPRRPRYRRIDRETERHMFNGTVQWQPNEFWDLSLTGVYASDDISQDLNQQVFLFNADEITPIGEPVNGTYNTIQINDFTLENNRQLEERDLTSQAITADATWTDDVWEIKGVLHYTAGEANESEEAAILATIIPEAYLDISDRNNVIFEISEDLADPALYPAVMPRNEYPNGATRYMESDETSFQLDFKRMFEDSVFTSVSFGAKYRTETFDRAVYRRDRAAIGDAAPEDLPSMAETGFLVTGFLDGNMSIPHSWIAPNIQAYREALIAEGADVPVFFAAQSSYSIDRDVFASYVMTDFAGDLGSMPFRGNIGVRYETTDRELNTYLTGDTNPLNEEIREVVGEYTAPYDYDDLLPSFNFVLEVTEDVQVRFAAAKVLVRPIITSRTQLAASETSSDNSEGTRTYDINLGQPNMKAMTANQADIGVEWYYGEGAGLTFNAFWKDVKNGVVSDLVCPAEYDGTALSTSGTECVDAAGNFYNITSTYNDSSTVGIDGYEVGWNQSLDDLLPLDGFGITANYTNISVDESEGYTLSNSSEETWNFTGYWENDTFSARASLNHRSPYIQENEDSFFAREGRTVDSRNQIDVVLGWNVNDQLSLSLGALNITGDDEEAYKENESRWQTTSVIGRSYYLSMMYQL